MKARALLAVSCIAVVPVSFAACAGEGSAEPIAAEASVSLDSGTSDAEVDTDASTDADAGACVDCEYFPDTCSGDVFCQTGPFVAGAPGGSLDPRTRINVIRGRSESDVWAAGALGAVGHFDGTSWKLSDTGVPMSMHALWLRETGEVALSTMHALYTRGVDTDVDASAGGWSPAQPSTVPFELIVGNPVSLASTWAAPSAQWMWCAATTEGSMDERKTGLWRMRMSGSGAFEIGIGAPSELCRYTHPCTQMSSIHGRSANELWAVGSAGATIRITDADGDTPSFKGFNAQTTNALNGVWVADNGEAWAVGARGTIRHYRGDALLWDVVAEVPTSVELNAVWGTSPSDVWAVGNSGVVLHFDGERWSRVAIGGLGRRRPDLTTVWASGPGHVWIGGQGVLLTLGGNQP